MSMNHDYSLPSGKIFMDLFRKTIGPYSFQSSHVYSNLVEEHSLTYPNVGYVNVDMIVRDDFDLVFENYPFVRGKPGQINICGMMPGDPVICRQSGKVSFYTMRRHPVMVYHMLKEPMQQLKSLRLPLTEILPKQNKLLKTLEEGQECKSWSNPHLEKVLSQLFPPVDKLKNDPIFHAVNLIAKSDGRVLVSELCQRLNINERTFNRQFIKKVGISPKSYAKIWQWQYVAELLNGNPAIKLQDLAYLAGFYDVSHLINDFKIKTNMTPEQYKHLDKTILEGYVKC